SVDYPVKAEPGASVLLEVAGKKFGPAVAGADGKVKVAIEVPPGVQRATRVSIVNGAEKREDLDLKIPETRRIQLVPLPEVLPADPDRVVPLRVVVVDPTGEPDDGATPVFTPSAGTLGQVVNRGGGVYEAGWRLPAEPGPATVAVTLGGASAELQQDTAAVTLVARRPAAVALTPSAAEIGPDTQTIDVVAKVTDATGAGLAGLPLVVGVTGAAKTGDVVDLGTGEYKITLDPDDAGSTDLHVAVAGPPTANPVAAVTVVPSAGRVANDGSSALEVVVAATDAVGVPVHGATVVVDLVAGDGKFAPHDHSGLVTSTTVATGDDGTGRTTYTAGTAAGIVGVRASSGAAIAVGSILQVPAGVAAVAMPVAGTADATALAKGWAASTPSLAIPRAGAGAVVAAAPTSDTPWSAPVPAALGPSIRLVTDVPVAKPGSTVTLTATALDASGASIVGTTPELVVTGASVGAPTVNPDGSSTVTLAVPASAVGDVQIVAKAGEVTQTLSIPVEVPEADPWSGAVVDTAVPAEAATPSEPVAPKPPSTPSDARWFRARISGIASTYRYAQSPSDAPGPLLPSRLAVGGPDGGSPASPVGGELDLRMWGDGIELPALGVHGQVRLSSYGIAAAVFDDVARDALTNVEIDLLARYPFDVAGDRYWVGGKAGFHYNDFLLFTGCLDVGCTVAYEPVTIPGLGIGAELGAEVGDLYLVGGYTLGLAQGSEPYSNGLDVDLGYEFVDAGVGGLFADLGFSMLTRSVVLEGQDSGLARGSLDDSQMMVKLGVGFSM
ncbi:MAG: invasin domain 3-containing protein, partial [Myxococcota bacterium]